MHAMEIRHGTCILSCIETNGKLIGGVVGGVVGGLLLTLLVIIICAHVAVYVRHRRRKSKCYEVINE